MSIDDYPYEEEIKEIRKAIEELKLSGDIGALQLAESDLQYLLTERVKCNNKDELR